MKHTHYFLVLIIVSIALISCRKKIEICSDFDSTSYLVGDTIQADASCSKNVETFLWEPEEGLTMIGNGNNSTERFIVEPLSGALSRSVNLTLSNSKSSRSRTESVIVF